MLINVYVSQSVSQSVAEDSWKTAAHLHHLWPSSINVVFFIINSLLTDEQRRRERLFLSFFPFQAADFKIDGLF